MEPINLKPHFSCQNQLSLAIGVFDGLHRGHQELIAKLERGASAILTFENVTKDKHMQKKILTTLEDKVEIAYKLGVKNVFYIEFKEEFRSLKPEEFVDLYLRGLNIKRLVIGEDFRFGIGASGSAETLRRLLPKQEIIEVPLLKYKGQKVSTTNIISSLLYGDIDTANDELTRPYKIKGTITHGLRNGVRLGFPTANIVPTSNYVIPACGVYATRINIGNSSYLSMTNIGTHPTIDQLKTPSIETHIFDFEQEIYGSEIELEFLSHIREERKFIDSRQLQIELEKNRKYIKKHFVN